MKAIVVNVSKSRYQQDGKTIYAGRSGGAHMLNTKPRKCGWLGNPYYVDEYAFKNGDPLACMTRETAIERFKVSFYFKVSNDPEFAAAVRKYCTGKKLNCFCHPEICHAQIIADYVNSFLSLELEKI